MLPPYFSYITLNFTLTSSSFGPNIFLNAVVLRHLKHIAHETAILS